MPFGGGKIKKKGGEHGGRKAGLGVRSLFYTDMKGDVPGRAIRYWGGGGRKKTGASQPVISGNSRQVERGEGELDVL